MTKSEQEQLEFWRYRAFKLAQALVSSTFVVEEYKLSGPRPGTFGHLWHEEAIETQEIYRRLDGPEHIERGKEHIRDWNPEWETDTL